MSKRAYSITNGEVSAIFWGIGLIMSVVVIFHLMAMNNQVSSTNPGLAITFIFLISLLAIGKFFDFLSMAVPNYQISKHNLNLFVDKITNPDYIGWIRFTRNKKIRIHTVKTGPLGQTKGIANNEKADAINDGSYTVTLPNGNQAIIVNDFLSTNINLENAVGWNLIHKHFKIIGFKAWEKCAEDKKLLFEPEEKNDR